jgi:hypothetical protein
MQVPRLVGTVITVFRTTSTLSRYLVSIRITDNPTAAEVKPGYSFAVWAGSTYKGEARVTEEYEGIAYCTVASTKQGTTIEPGDRAATQPD